MLGEEYKLCRYPCRREQGCISSPLSDPATTLLVILFLARFSAVFI
jgi:hypothetical protein